jgi:thiamine kinase-like enzyme
MLAMISKSPLHIRRYGRQLALLHHTVHQCSSDKLESLHDKFAGAINASRGRLGDKAGALIASLPPAGAGDRICHGDFHPDNIMISSEALIIDWAGAYSGDPLSDVARSLLMINSPYMPPEVPALIKLLSRILKKYLARVYLSEYLRLSGRPAEEIKGWLPVVAAARLIEKIPGEEGWLLSMLENV